MVHFARVRLSGFKSFVDPTEVEVNPGLTGIVGPNGCGKSNILEALRWCMGEGSARQLRGGGMDDVIFNGTSDRPARNIAEVAIMLDNAERDAPGGFNDYDEIEVVRRIERDGGSVYRVNGREVRARDVQLLFADLSTGARSTAIVSQGRIGSLINAKPEARRLLLEEAAGITGLHSRRHEAELRLKAAETNLERLDDVVSTLGGQLQGLKRQARQATRYRNLSEQIRTTEATLLHLRWNAGVAALEEARTLLAEVSREVGELSAESARLSTQSTEAGARLPELRQREAETAAALQRHMVAREALEAEEKRLADRRAELESRISQIESDLIRERGHVEDAAAAIARLDAEATALREQEADTGALDAARQERDALRASVDEREAEATELTRRIAARTAERENMVRRIEELSERQAQLRARYAEIEAELAELPDTDTDAELAVAESAVAEAERDLAEQRRRGAELEAARDTARQDADAANAALREAEEALGQLRAEERALRSLLDQPDDQHGPAVVDRIKVTPGYETALGAALGDDLEASLEAAASVHWAEGRGAEEDSPALPSGVRPLAWYVEAPSALDRRLEQIGVVEDESDGARLADALVQGQRLVSRTGALWRWDGLTVRADTPTAAAKRLEQRNRLADLEREAVEAEHKTAARRERRDAARRASEEADTAAKAGGAAVEQAFEAATKAKDARSSAAEQATIRNSRRTALADEQARLSQEIEQLDSRLDATRATLADTPSAETEEAQLAELRATLASERERLSARESDVNRQDAEIEARRRRQAAIAEEIGQWSSRRENGEAHVAQLEARRAEAEAGLAETAAAPDALGERRKSLDAVIDEAQTAKHAASSALAEAENGLAEIDSALRRTESRLADARELRGRREGAVSQAEQTLEAVEARIRERLRCAPAEVRSVAAIEDEDALPAADEIEKKLERLLRERDGMGPVNHRAEQEATELQEQIDTYETERADLIGAIERFRKAIAELNREGRERLLESFNSVNEHFKDLFARLFGGGSAHLALTEAEDPLDAGLEVMASPPGKRLQSLSLLSGGEQALTALALMFAVFMTNPAPICILDEVDAPLDDANVDRFCSLLEDLARSSATRFLLVTHHRMTMARMDRLYGVTMGDRGVSRLVSVDLGQAEALRESA